jgi:acyl transferase domain-containing protein
MQWAADQCPFPTTMMAIIHPEGINPIFVMDAIEKCKAASDNSEFCCDIAAINSDEHIVLSGFTKSVQQTIDWLQKEHRIRRTKIVSVSAPFHSSVMQPALIPYAVPLTDEECGNSRDYFKFYGSNLIL